METVYFGPPRSFSAGENHRGISVFPPAPNTFQGLIRSRMLQAALPPLDLHDWSEKARREREELVGGPDVLPEGWNLKGPFPARMKNAPNAEKWEEPWAEPWVHTPRFLLKPGDDPDAPPVAAAPVLSAHPGINDCQTGGRLFGNPGQDALTPLHGWIGPDNLYFALTGRGNWDKKQFALKYPPFVVPEMQPGLAIDREKGTAAPSLLYFLETLRFSFRSGLMGYFSGTVSERIPDDALHSGTGTAGRKGRRVAFDKMTRIHPSWNMLMEGRHLPDRVGEEDRFWLLSLTPCRISGPAEPMIKPSLPGGVSMEILAALTGPPVYFGGYAMATGRSRPNQAYAPAGSTWWFALNGGNEKERAAALDTLNNSHALAGERESSFGYGHCLVGIGMRNKE